MLLYNDDLIYLEKRPPTGLWGGLWCLPSIDFGLCPTSYVLKTYKMNTLNRQELMTIRHSFSHFHLQIKALSLQANLTTNSLAEYTGRWFSPKDITTLGLAKPMSIIIDYFLQQNVS